MDDSLDTAEADDLNTAADLATMALLGSYMYIAREYL